MTKAWYPLLGQWGDTKDEAYNYTGCDDGPWDFPEAHSNEPTWIMKNGEEILISKMGDRHLINTLRLIERMWKNLRENPPPPSPIFHGEMAWELFEQAWDQWEDGGDGELDIVEFCPSYSDLAIEATKRKLSWTPGWIVEDDQPKADDLIHHVNRRER